MPPRKQVKKQVKKQDRKTEDLSKPSLKRLAKVAGCEKSSGDIVEGIRTLIERAMDNLIPIIATYMEHSRKKTFSLEFLRQALKQKGVSYLGGKDIEFVVCKTEELVKKSMKLSSAGNCLYIGKAPFNRVLKEKVIQSVREDLRFTSSFLDNFHYFIEQEVIKFIRSTNNIVRALSKRRTLTKSDLEVILQNSPLWLFS